MATIRKYFLRPWVVMPLVAVVALGAWWIWFRPDDGADAATADTDQVVAATTGTMAQTVSAEGTIAAAQTDDLSFTSAGTVTAVNVKAGQAVKAGDVLATIDSAELAADVAEAEATVADAEAKLADDEDAGASDAQLDADASALASVQDKLDAAQDDLAGAQLVATFDGTVASVDLTVGEQLASDGTGSTDPTGSGSGSGQTGNNLGGGNGSFAPDASDGSSGSTAQIQVVSTSSFTIDLGFDDTDIGNLAVGQTASIALSTSSQSVAFPGGGEFPPGGFGNFTGGPPAGSSDAFTAPNGDAGTDDSGGATDSGLPVVSDTPSASGTVTEVGAVADASSGVASYPVTVSFTDTTGDYHPGATATVTITYAQVENVVQVPAMAVTTTNGTATVTVATDDGERETRTVTTGLRSGTMVEITSGLAAGEQVVITLPEGIRFGGPPGGSDQ